MFSGPVSTRFGRIRGSRENFKIWPRTGLGRRHSLYTTYIVGSVRPNLPVAHRGQLVGFSVCRPRDSTQKQDMQDGIQFHRTDPLSLCALFFRRKNQTYQESETQFIPAHLLASRPMEQPVQIRSLQEFDHCLGNVRSGRRLTDFIIKKNGRRPSSQSIENSLMRTAHPAWTVSVKQSDTQHNQVFVRGREYPFLQPPVFAVRIHSWGWVSRWNDKGIGSRRKPCQRKHAENGPPNERRFQQVVPLPQH